MVWIPYSIEWKQNPDLNENVIVDVAQTVLTHSASTVQPMLCIRPQKQRVSYFTLVCNWKAWLVWITSWKQQRKCIIKCAMWPLNTLLPPNWAWNRKLSMHQVLVQNDSLSSSLASEPLLLWWHWSVQGSKVLTTTCFHSQTLFHQKCIWLLD